ncbi:MAG TPA: glycosyltransferase, partial [Thermoanaerobaculia bacterium]|nr:glycosyltransferase [Thermoanaerobaculia bacterium]
MTRLFVCTPTAAVQGGVERILESLATHLPSRGFEVTFGLAKGLRFHDPDAFRAAMPAIRGVDLDATSGTSYARRRALRRAIVAADPDIVLIARLFDAYPVVAELKRAGHRVRLGVTIQAYEADYFVDLERYAEFVDVCVTSGELIARTVVERSRLPREIVRSIPGGVAAPRRFVEPREGPLRIGYVGRIEQLQKRVLDLVALDAELRRRGVAFTLVVAGSGSVDLQLPDARMLGWVSTHELYERVYPELDVLVHFAEWEGITIAPREAMAHGVVPVMSRFPGHETEFAADVNSLTFPVGDVSAAADAIERLDRDRVLLARLSRAARSSQSGIRSEEGAIDAWADAFRFALARPARLGAALPPAPADHGLLTRLYVPPALAELVRRFRKRAYDDPGSEWPHASRSAVAAESPLSDLRIEKRRLRRRTPKLVAGALVYDWPRFLRHINTSWTLIHNRDERITTDGRGVRCEWEFTSDLHIAKVFPSTSSWLMRRALRDWPITLRDQPSEATPDVTFLIGHRGTTRLPHLLATLRSIAGQKDIAIECIVIEQAATREIESALPQWVRYLHTPVPPDLEYCRSATFNAGAEIARGRVLVLHDNDMLLPERYAA